jgi:hypothetical protein
MRARRPYAPQPGPAARRGRVRCAHSSFVWRRSLFEEDRFDFAVSLRILEPNVGRLGRRVFGTASARAISSSSRARASARLASCVRCWRAVMINTPSCVARLPANARRRCRTSSERARDWPTSKRSWTAVETLLTFWPPGPEARTKVIVSSESGMNMGKRYFQNSLDDHTDTRAHFLKILSRAFPLASSSTSLSR